MHFCIYDLRDKKGNGYIKTRHVLAMLAFFAMMNVFCMRFSLSVVIIAMVNSTVQSESGTNITSSIDVCPYPGINQSSNQVTSEGSFNWDPKQQGILLGSYFYGYVCSNILGGYLAKRFGIRLAFGLQMLISSVLTLLSPSAAQISYQLFVALRVVLGFCQGMSFPTMYSAWQKWAPPMERTFMTSLHNGGAILGSIIIMPLAGVMGQYFGWKSVFYLTGGVSLFWSLLWLAIVHDSPQTHPRISEEEKLYIVQSIGPKKESHVAIPWFKIMTSRHTWAIYVAHFTMNYGMNMMFLLLPTYISKVLHFDLFASGILSSIPYILHWLCLIFGGWYTDWVRRRGIVRTITIRKFNTVIGQVPPAVFLLLAGYVGCDSTAAVVFFSVSTAMTGFVISGCESNVYDIVPDFPQIVYGVSNTIATSTGFIAPSVVGLLRQDDQSINQWRIAFWVASSVYVFGAIFYCLLGTDKVQIWGTISKTESIELNEKQDKDIL